MHVSDSGVIKPGAGKGMFLNRPKTAATSSVYDESRIKDKLKYLEKMQELLESDINEIIGETPEDFDDDELIDFVKVKNKSNN